MGVVRGHLIDRAFMVIPEVHRDWSWIVHPDRDLSEGLKNVVKRCPEQVVAKRVRDYEEVRKVGKVVIAAKEGQSDSRGEKREVAAIPRTEGRTTRKKTRAKMADLRKSSGLSEVHSGVEPKQPKIESEPIEVRDEE